VTWNCPEAVGMLKAGGDDHRFARATGRLRRPVLLADTIVTTSHSLEPERPPTSAAISSQSGVLPGGSWRAQVVGVT
jgi:hypothetical protein